MSRRLVQRSGARASSSSTATTTLPEYQPPSCPLNDEARLALGTLSNGRGNATYEMNIKDSIRFLGSSVGDIHERLREQREKLQHTRSRREEKGKKKTDEETRLEEHVADLETKVNALTDKSELAMRDLIDRRAELEDEGPILRELYTLAAGTTASAVDPSAYSRRRPRRGGDSGSSPPPGDDTETETKPTITEAVAAPSVLKLYNDQRSQKRVEYTNMSMQQRYALDNDYAGFKKLWHDAMAGEDGPPLADPSRWFRPDGQPVMRGAADAGGPSNGDENDDDDIAVAREVLSIKCPLTLQPMQEPYSSRKCKHTFEKAALLEYLNPPNRELQCPQTGCSQTFTRNKFEENFYYDQAMARRIKRAQAREQQELDDEELAEGSGDDDVEVRGQKRIPGRPMKRERER